MKRPEFTNEQEQWICQEIGNWYLYWVKRVTTPDTPHRLGFATEQLKRILCDFNPDELINKVIKQQDEKEKHERESSAKDNQ